jgi:hypothetical protein
VSPLLVNYKDKVMEDEIGRQVAWDRIMEEKLNKNI